MTVEDLMHHCKELGFTVGQEHINELLEYGLFDHTPEEPENIVTLG